MEGLRLKLAEMGYPITEDPGTIVDKTKTRKSLTAFRLDVSKSVLICTIIIYQL